MYRKIQNMSIIKYQYEKITRMYPSKGKSLRHVGGEHFPL